MTEDKQFEALDIIHEMLQECSYVDAVHNVMFKIPLPLVNRAEKLLDEENFIAKKYYKIDKSN